MELPNYPMTPKAHFVGTILYFFFFLGMQQIYVTTVLMNSFLGFDVQIFVDIVNPV